MNVTFRLIPWLLILAPFLILAFSYPELPNDILISRSFLGDQTVVAPKSLFTVFRVPLIELVCGAAIEIMRRGSRESQPSDLFWTVLLYTVGLKSILQAIEVVASRDLWYVTLFVVLAGMLIALIAGRKLFSDFGRFFAKFSPVEALALVALLLAYLGLAILPVYIFG